MESPWIRRRKIKLAELVNEPWTWPSARTMLDALVIDAFRARGLEAPRATVYASDVNTRLKLAATGRFLAVVTANNVKSLATDAPIKVLPVDLFTKHRQIGIISLKNRTLSPLALLFIERIREIAQSLARRR